MPDIDSYVPGTPSWVDVSAPDTDAAAAFYSALFGWTAGDAGPIETTGGYRIFSMRGRSVAGLAPTREGGPPPMWGTYVTVADADATCEQIGAAGGTVNMEPMDVLTAGRMAVASDPGGAVFCIWQKGDHIGCEIVNEPSALIWNELDTRDLAGSEAFYGTVFGWTAETQTAPGGNYTTFSLGGDSVAGMMEITADFPPGVPPNWLAYFAVEDCEDAVAKVVELGGSVRMAPMTVPIGTFAVLGDPHGAVFAVVQMA